MRVGWLQDDHGYIGGAELTSAEFRAAAPEGVEIIDCLPGEVKTDLDAYFVGNCVQYDLADVEGLPNVTKYVNDLWPHARDPEARDWLLAHAKLVFCSPLHLEKFRHPLYSSRAPYVIPPALDLNRFRPTRQAKRNTQRSGTCTLAGWRNPGKGAQAIEEWAAESGPVDVYGGGNFGPGGPHVIYRGELPYAEVPQVLWAHERFVFLPNELEPFCRCVAEAHLAGCDVVTNRRVGAMHYLEQDTEALETAADDLWGVLLS